jgi:hypothetical protein
VAAAALPVASREAASGGEFVPSNNTAGIH